MTWGAFVIGVNLEFDLYQTNSITFDAARWEDYDGACLNFGSAGFFGGGVMSQKSNPDLWVIDMTSKITGWRFLDGFAEELKISMQCYHCTRTLYMFQKALLLGHQFSNINYNIKPPYLTRPLVKKSCGPQLQASCIVADFGGTVTVKTSKSVWNYQHSAIYFQSFAKNLEFAFRDLCKTIFLLCV